MVRGRSLAGRAGGKVCSVSHVCHRACTARGEGVQTGVLYCCFLRVDSSTLRTLRGLVSPCTQNVVLDLDPTFYQQVLSVRLTSKDLHLAYRFAPPVFIFFFLLSSRFLFSGTLVIRLWQGPHPA